MAVSPTAVKPTNVTKVKTPGTVNTYGRKDLPAELMSQLSKKRPSPVGAVGDILATKTTSITVDELLIELYEKGSLVKRAQVTNALNRLITAGQVRKVSMGVYINANPQPKSAGVDVLS